MTYITGLLIFLIIVVLIALCIFIWVLFVYRDDECDKTEQYLEVLREIKSVYRATQEAVQSIYDCFLILIEEEENEEEDKGE